MILVSDSDISGLYHDESNNSTTGFRESDNNICNFDLNNWLSKIFFEKWNWKSNEPGSIKLIFI